MKIKAEQKHIRTSARKLRLVATSLKGLSPKQALDQLAVIDKRAADPLAKVIKQALANANNNHKISQQQVKIEHIMVNEGPTFKRWRAVSRGRAHSILKRTSHVKVILETLIASVPTVTQPSLKKATVKPVEAETTTVKPTKITKTKTTKK